MSMSLVGVALVTNGRCPPLLCHLVERWLSLGAEVAVAGATGAFQHVGEHKDIHLVPFDTSPGRHGDCFQAAIDALQRPYVLITGDDILPVGPEWHGPLPLTPGTIQAIRLISVTGQRWGDWAYYDGRSVYNQHYDEMRPGTYITGGSQLISPEVRAAVRYSSRVFHAAADIGVCHDAVAKGFELRPPVVGGPVLIHLDRWPSHPGDPERLHIPL